MFSSTAAPPYVACFPRLVPQKFFSFTGFEQFDIKKSKHSKLNLLLLTNNKKKGFSLPSESPSDQTREKLIVAVLGISNIYLRIDFLDAFTF